MPSLAAAKVLPHRLHRARRRRRGTRATRMKPLACAIASPLATRVSRPLNPGYASRGLLLALAAAVAGCTMGPDYVRPKVDTPAAFRFEPKAAADTANTLWWK